jgi:hypothetical protein
LVPSLTIPDVARLPFDGREDALVLGRVGSFSNLLGSGAVQSCRNLVDQRGVDPAAIRGAVEANAGAPMTPLPAGSIWDEIRVVSQVGDGLRVRCPIWTQTGRSGLAMEIIVERTEFGSLYVDALVDDRGDTVMSTADAPAADQPVGVGPPGEEPIAAGGDPRIRRKAFVGASYGVLIGQLVRGMERAVGSPLEHLDRLNPGQAAVAILDFAFSRINGDGLQSLYESYVDGIESLVVSAAQRVGATAYAEVFSRVRDLVPSGLRGDGMAVALHFIDATDDAGMEQWQSFERELYGLEDAGDLIWDRMLRYIEANPDEFFRE